MESNIYPCPACKYDGGLSHTRQVHDLEQRLNKAEISRPGLGGALIAAFCFIVTIGAVYYYNVNTPESVRKLEIMKESLVETIEMHEDAFRSCLHHTSQTFSDDSQAKMACVQKHETNTKQINEMLVQLSAKVMQ